MKDRDEYWPYSNGQWMFSPPVAGLLLLMLSFIASVI